MKRTQIYLDERVMDVLRDEGRRRRMKISGLIREALNEKYSKKKKNPALLKSLSGLWADRDFDVEQYVRRLRNDDRLSRLYGK